MLSSLKSFKKAFKPSASIAARDMFIIGDKYRDSRNWSDAAEHYRGGLILNPDAFEIWVQLGHVLKESGSFQEAEKAYLQAKQMNPADADLNLQLGHFYSLSGQNIKAREYYARALASGSTESVVGTSSGASDTSDSVKELDVAKDSFRNADACRDAHQWAEAAIWYEKGLALEPDAFDFWVQLGHVLKENGVMQRAEAAYLRALELRYSDGDLAVQLGHLYAGLKDNLRAADHYARAVGLGMRDPYALSFLTQQPEHYLSLKLALLRANPGKLHRLEVLGLSDIGLSFAQFILRYAA